MKFNWQNFIVRGTILKKNHILIVKKENVKWNAFCYWENSPKYLNNGLIGSDNDKNNDKNRQMKNTFKNGSFLWKKNKVINQFLVRYDTVPFLPNPQI